MMLVQESNQDQEHVVYYFSKSLIESKICYSHVEKLALAIFITIQIFHHYIFLHTITIIVDSNPMYHILT